MEQTFIKTLKSRDRAEMSDEIVTILGAIMESTSNAEKRFQVFGRHGVSLVGKMVAMIKPEMACAMIAIAP